MLLTHYLLMANFLALAGVLGWLWLLQRKALDVASSAAALAEQAGALPRDLVSEAGIAPPPTPFYTIEILNPLEVAALESQLGDVFGRLTPALVRRAVHRRAHGIIRRQFEERGIKVDVKLHGLD